MHKKLKYVFFIVLLFIAGCTNTLSYHDNDIAAIVRGKEITIGELRFLYPDEKVLDMIEEAVKVELVMQEVKRMNLDVLGEDNENHIEDILLSNQELVPFPEFTEKQAQKLGIESGNFNEEYLKIITEQNAYMVTYIQEMIGEPEGIDEELKKYSESANHLLNRLVKENQDEIEILIP